MDRGLQERLVGAAVLVALGVWLIPWVLDGAGVDQPSAEQADALKLPTPESAGGSVMRRQTIELSPERTAQVKSPATEEVSAETPEPEAVAVVEMPPPAPAQSAPVAAPATSEHAQPSATAATASLERESAATEATAMSLPEIIAASPVTGWMVQLGSFSDSRNARRQAQRVETFGHDARIYEFAAAGGRTMFRVRLGPLDSRERAEVTASSLAAHGFVAQLVAPE